MNVRTRSSSPVGSWRTVSALSALVVAILLLHRSMPTHSHAWHVVHLVAERLYFVPLLMSAALLARPGAAWVAILVIASYAVHVVLDWRGRPMVQAEQAANLATFGLVSAVASLLFGRWRDALEREERAHEDTMTALAGSLELREAGTAGHSDRVRAYALLLAEQLGLRDPEELRILAAGALFHDVGKIGIADAILNKPGPLTDGERRAMRRHPDLGADLVGRLSFLERAADLVRSHHERFDGAGYPRGLRGDSIPRAARIFAVADAFDAMTGERPYRSAVTYEEARRRLLEERGRQFDPAVIDAFEALGQDRWSASAARFGVSLRPA